MTGKRKTIGDWGRLAFRVFSGFELATILLLILMAATFFGTLEQKEVGLYQAQKKYFDLTAFWVQPHLNGKAVWIVLPGVFWTSALLFVNLVLGGVVRARKGWKTVGVLIAHFGMLLLLVAGLVSHLRAREGLMRVFEGDRSDYAMSYHDPSIEIHRLDGEGGRMAPVVVGAEAFEGLDPDETLAVRLPELPFDLVIRGFRRNSELVEESREASAGAHEPVVDGFYLRMSPPYKEAERNQAGCYATVVGKDGRELRRLVLHQTPGSFPTPVTVKVGGSVYEISLVREIWPMPFEVELHRSVGEYYPGTGKPRWFQSDITRVLDGDRKDYSIVMNKPMRTEGITLYQAQWDRPRGRAYSGFAIVRNPSDQWPKYALYIAAAGLLIHFLSKLGRFLAASPRTKTDDKEAL